MEMSKIVDTKINKKLKPNFAEINPPTNGPIIVPIEGSEKNLLVSPPSVFLCMQFAKRDVIESVYKIPEKPSKIAAIK